MGELLRKPSLIRPWEKYYNQNYINNNIPECLMYDALCDSANGKEESVALEYYGNEVSYKELIEKIDLYAASFSKIGIKKGDTVSFVTVSIPESIYAIYGLNKIGAISNLIDVRTDSSHICEYILEAKSKAIVILDIAYKKIAERIDELNAEHIIVQSASDSLSLVKGIAYKIKNRTKVSYSDRVIKNRDFEQLGRGEDVKKAIYEKDMPSIITRTGGTTGTSKGVILTNDSMNAVYSNFRDVVGDSSGDSLLNFLPIGASYGIACGIHMALCMSVKNILIPKFSPEKFADLIANKKPNHIVGVPIFYEYMMNNKRMRNADLSYIKTMAAGGDSATEEFERKLRNFTKKHGVIYPLAQGYGMSETTSACSFGIRDIHKDGSAGIPCIHSTIGIFEPGTDKELDFMEQGEICISGPTLMKEYLNKPEETMNIMRVHSDGNRWIHSGDIGYIDEDGFLFITGRIKRAITRFDGHKVYPAQIEEIVYKNNLVKSCAVIGVKDTKHEKGELPLVIVEPTNKQEKEHAELRLEILKECQDNLEERSKPIDVAIIKNMPLTINGKKDVKTLEELFHYYDYGKTNK